MSVVKATCLRGLRLNMSLFCVVVCFLGACSLGMAQTCLASDLEESYYTDLHQGYIGLSREDPNVTQRSRWDELIGEANAFVARGLSSEIAPKTLFLLVRMHEHIFSKHKEAHELAAALEWSERLVQQYPESQLADEALFTLGKLEESGRGDSKASQRAFRRILEDYPDGNMAPEAQKRLGVKKTSAQQAKSEKKRGLFSNLFGSSKNNSSGEKNSQTKTDRGNSFKEHPLAKRFPRQPVVVIDPGHGGEEDGAHGRNKVLEKEIVLNISLMLEEHLRKRLKVKTVLTRVRDVTVELSERTQLANQHEADLFISIHANASPSKKMSGVETYYLDNTNDRSSLRLAERENASSQQQLSDLGFMLSDLIQNAKLEDSISLAHYVQDALMKDISVKYPDTKNLGVKKAPFFVLVGAHMPCVLAEVSFIDHKIQGPRLATREYQQIIAESLFKAIINYFEQRWIPQESAKKNN